MRKTKEAAAETRQKVLDAALKVFSEKGYQAARLEDIAEEAGVTRGAIYWHFGSKEQPSSLGAKANLYNTLVGTTMQGIQSVVERAVAVGGSFLDVQRRVMVYIIRMLEDDARYRAVMELTILKTGYAPELAEGIRKKNEIARQVEQEVAAVFRRGIAAGAIRADLDPVICARAMQAYINGVCLNWILDPTAFSLRDCAPALVDVFIRGVAPPGQA